MATMTKDFEKAITKLEERRTWKEALKRSADNFVGWFFNWNEFDTEKMTKQEEHLIWNCVYIFSELAFLAKTTKENAIFEDLEETVKQVINENEFFGEKEKLEMLCTLYIMNKTI